jgi:glycosyltransferase involved in cell wall biosynthesis
MPRFSVIVPAYNAASTIEATVRSVLAQTAADLELIVVDDGSSDGTRGLVAAIAGSDSRVELITQPNEGVAGARNTGIDRASAAYVSFLDNDDLWLPRYLEAAGEALDAATGAAFSYCDAWSLVHASSRIRRRTELEVRPGPEPGSSWEQVFLTLASRNFVMSSATVRAGALREVGGFAREVTGTDDYDLWFRLMLAGHTAVRAGNTPLLLQRDRNDSQSKDDVLMLNGLRLVLERTLADGRTPPAARPVLEHRIQDLERSIGAGRLEQIWNVLRRRGAKLREQILPGTAYAETPPEVAAAFPELAHGIRGRGSSQG